MPANIFRDNVTIITGASAGIGFEIAKQLAVAGAKLVLAAREPARLANAANVCRQLGASVIAIPTDVADKAQCRKLIDFLVGLVIAMSKLFKLMFFLLFFLLFSVFVLYESLQF